ncbi:uncharacterized protein [Argopecten irradians]
MDVRFYSDGSDPYLGFSASYVIYGSHHESTTLDYETGALTDRTTLYYDVNSASIAGKMTLPYGTSFKLSGQQLRVYHNGRWGTVCDDGFNHETTEAICYLIYKRWPSSVRYFSGGYDTTTVSNSPNTIWLDELHCNNAYPYYPSCTANYWGINNCGHSEDIYIYCNYDSTDITLTDYHQQTTTAGRINLVPGTKFRLQEGQLQVYRNGIWGSVCIEGFDMRTVRGICYRIYGKWPSIDPYYTNVINPRARYTWLNHVQCTADYYYGPQCTADPWGDYSCTTVEIGCYISDNEITTPKNHKQTTMASKIDLDTGIQFRLDERQLQVYHNGIWGSVCKEGLDMTTVRILCYRIYGRWPSMDPYYTNVFYPRARHTWLNHVRCADDYYYGPQCTAEPWGDYSCATVEIGCYISDVETTVETPTTMAYPVSPSSSSGSDLYVRSITVDCNPDAWNIMIYLPELYKRHADFDPSDIYLGRPGCQGYRVGNYLRIDQQYSNCDTYHFMTFGRVEYTNTLVYAYRDPNYKFIIREYRFKIDVECDMATRETVSQHFIESHNQVRKRSNNPHISGSGHYHMHMSFYSDRGFQQQMLGNPLTVSIGQDIFVSVNTPLSDFDVKMKVDSCYTLPTPDAGNQYKFYLIKDGCSSDMNTHVLYLSSHDTRFVFRDFEYDTNQDNLYLFCTATFCNVTDYSSACDQSCHSVKKRSVQSASQNFLRRVETSDVFHLSKGRSRRGTGEQDEVDTSGHAQYISVDDHLFIAVIVSAVGISVIAIFVAIRRYKKPRSRPIDTI